MCKVAFLENRKYLILNRLRTYRLTPDKRIRVSDWCVKLRWPPIKPCGFSGGLLANLGGGYRCGEFPL